MSRFAGRVVKRYGATEEAFQIFMEEAAKCNPPLDDEELGKIWSSACRFAKKVQSQEGYIPPDKYKPGWALKPADYSDIGQAKVVAMDCANELAYSTGTDFLFYDGKRWVESKPKSVGCMENFLDRQLAEAMEAVAKTREALMQLGIAEQAISAGGKALEKQIQADQMKAYMAYLGAVSYYGFVMKRRDVKYINSALMAVPDAGVFTAESMRCRALCTAGIAVMCFSAPIGTAGAERRWSGAASPGCIRRIRRSTARRGP
jgi:hypothetical protein